MKTRTFLVKFISVFLIIPLELFAQNTVNPLSITVMEGANAVIDETHTPAVIVRVTAVGSSVTFQLPENSGVTFAGGKSQVTVKSDSQGFATSGSISPKANGGKFDIQISANYEGRSTSTVVHATNASHIDTAAGAKPHKSHTMLWVLIGAGAAGAAALAASRGGSSESIVNKPAITVTAGPPTVGAPQ